jgi:hypothetical protein
MVVYITIYGSYIVIYGIEIQFKPINLFIYDFLKFDHNVTRA